MTRSGIGGRMIDYFEKCEKESGYNEITLWAMAKNRIGTGFYSKMGYRPDDAAKMLERFNQEEVRYTKNI